MNAPPERKRPADEAGRGVDQQIAFAQRLYGDAERSARDGYRGTPAPREAPAQRDYATIAVDLAAAAGRLRALAGGIRLGGPTPEALADADRTVIGCGALLRELRQGVQ